MAAQILDVLGGDVQGVAARNAAAVDGIAGKDQILTPEAASKVPVPTRSPGLDPYIHLRNQNALPGAIG